MQFAVNATPDFPNLKKVKSEILTFLKPVPDFSFRALRRSYMRVVEEYCWATALTSSIPRANAWFVLLLCWVTIITGRRLGDNIVGGQLDGERQLN
jgi:hypothetical protein